MQNENIRARQLTLDGVAAAPKAAGPKSKAKAAAKKVATVPVQAAQQQLPKHLRMGGN